MGNFSHAVNDPFNTSNLLLTNVTNDGTYYGSHIEYISTLINQTNEYGTAISASANAGNSLSNLYDPLNPLAVQLKYIAQMISGGLQTKVYIVNVSGFDTHDSQVDQNSLADGSHALLLEMISDAVSAFQNDLQLLGIEERVAGMTFSEFGRQIASNGSFGTDHGDAAPIMLFGSCVNTGIIGPNPTIDSQINQQAGVPMQIDFRNVYASILRDWFEAPEQSIQALFEQNISFLDVLTGCSVGIAEQEEQKKKPLAYPNPTPSNTTLRFYSQGEHYQIFIVDQQGKAIAQTFDGQLSSGKQEILLETSKLPAGHYYFLITSTNNRELVAFQKV
jgi:hypothetical protein